MKQIIAVTRKELGTYFGSPMAFIFLGTFLAATLFAFFWVDTFFARGISDVRPLFRWMPILMIFLVAALTMRQWSEEQHSGTLETLLSLPIRPTQLVLGKFLATMILVAIALILTVPLPITVAMVGNLDGGPVIGGYLAAILLAAAYSSIGLFLSSRTDNQIVALISTALVGGVFYLVGTHGVTDFVGGKPATILRAIGTGSRFESIERGIIDVRDLTYYLSITVLFLTFNAISLDMKRWSHGARTRIYRRRAVYGVGFAAANLVLLNVWLYPLHGLRVDLTDMREYSLSPTTKRLIATLQEPLLVRAYISEKTHPLLAPLAPRIKDMLREYEIASRGKVAADVVDPTDSPEIEEEASQTYGIRPTPFQVSGRYEASVINSYFDILIRYGDQSVTLGFRDLIEVEPRRDGTLDVRLRNLEYDLTSAIKKTVYGFQSVDAVLSSLDDPAVYRLIVTPRTLPESLADAPATVEKIATEIAEKSDGKFVFTTVNPDDPNSPLSRQSLLDNYGLQPIAASLFSQNTYYLYMLLEAGGKTQYVMPAGELSDATVRTAIESALKRSSNGFLKVVGLWTPPDTPKPDPFGRPQPPFASWQLIQDQLEADYTVQKVTLSDGQVPADVDVLLLLAPQGLTDKDTFAVDQFLMRGGSVIAAAGNYTVEPDMFSGSLSVKEVTGGVRDLLEAYGIRVENGLVMDKQNEPFPQPVTRQLGGGIQIREIRALDYPLFVDVRPDGMDDTSPITHDLPTATINWASPIELDADKNAQRETHVLLRSSPRSWIHEGTDIQPDAKLGFQVQGDQDSYPVAVSTHGVFESYFKGKPSPFQPGESSDDEDSDGPGTTLAAGVIETSPESSRLVVIASGEFVNDAILRLSSTLNQNRYLNNLQLLQNAVDWSVEDLDLLSIRARGTQTRVLKPMDNREQTTWEVVNYAVALLALAAIGIVLHVLRRTEKPMVLDPSSPDVAGD